jgi:hypothetical protein
MADPVRLFTVIALVSLPTVMFGGYSLLRLLAARRLTGFQVSAFRAGHAHAGVLLVLSLVYLDVLARSGLGSGLRWLACGLLLVGVLAQSGGFFVHMGVGEPGRWSRGNTLTTGGGVLLAAAMLLLAVAVIVG